MATGNGAGTIEVVIEDDGEGLQDGFDTTRDAGLGLTIVQRLVIDQLRGQLRVENRSASVKPSLSADAFAAQAYPTSGTRTYLLLPD
jgi:two-component sensor histidine kinase